MIDDDRGQFTTPPAFIVTIVVLLIGIIVTAEVFDRVGFDGPAAIADFSATIEPVVQLIPLVFAALVLPLVLALFGVPVPVGYERGKIKWLTWCHTGMHAHICYWHGEGEDGRAGGLQSIHPDDLSDGDRS